MTNAIQIASLELCVCVCEACNVSRVSGDDLYQAHKYLDLLHLTNSPAAGHSMGR